MKQIVVMVSLMVGLPVAGAAPVDPTPSVTQQLGTIQQAVADVQTSVESISPLNQNNVRFTPPILSEPGGEVECDVLSVTNSSLRVIVDHVFGGAIVHTVIATLSVLNGARSRVVLSSEATPGLWSCRFTVTDGGDRTALRASIAFRGPETSDVRLALPAE